MRRLALTLGLVCYTLRVGAAEAPSFVRKVTTPAGVSQLETCIRRYHRDDPAGPEIYLTAVAHLGEPAYFAALQKHLDARDLVLFEGVGMGDPTPPVADQQKPKPEAPPADKPAAEKQPAPEPDHHSLQQKLAEALGLVFQLDALDYHHPRYRNNDISLAALRERLRDRQVDPDQLLQTMAGQGDMSTLILKMVSADAKSRAFFKCLMVEVLSQVADDAEGMQAPDETTRRLIGVLLSERNKVIFENLKTELAKTPAPGSIELIYGAAHMTNLASRLTDELHYKPVDETWLPAFGVNQQAEGLTEQDLTMIHLVQQMLKPKPKPEAKP